MCFDHRKAKKIGHLDQNVTFVTNIKFKYMKVDERLSIAELNDIFRPLQPEQRIAELYRHFTTNDVMLTSSFARFGLSAASFFGVPAGARSVVYRYGLSFRRDLDL